MKYLLILMMLNGCAALHHTDADLGTSAQTPQTEVENDSQEARHSFARVFSRILIGAGQGLQNAPRQNTYHCTSDGIGGYNCRD